MGEESEAYRTELTIYLDDPEDLPTAVTEGVTYRLGPAPAVAQRPGQVTDAVDDELAALLASAVVPVVASLLAAQEVEDVQLAWGVEPHDRDVWVRVVARGEVFTDLLDSPDWEGGGDRDAPTVAARLADHLEDWVCETAFAWGQRRRADYTLPST